MRILRRLAAKVKNFNPMWSFVVIACLVSCSSVLMQIVSRYINGIDYNCSRSTAGSTCFATAQSLNNALFVMLIANACILMLSGVIVIATVVWETGKWRRRYLYLAPLIRVLAMVMVGAGIALSTLFFTLYDLYLSW